MDERRATELKELFKATCERIRRKTNNVNQNGKKIQQYTNLVMEEIVEKKNKLHTINSTTLEEKSLLDNNVQTLKASKDQLLKEVELIITSKETYKHQKEKLSLQCEQLKEKLNGVKHLTSIEEKNIKLLKQQLLAYRLITKCEFTFLKDCVAGYIFNGTKYQAFRINIATSSKEVPEKVGEAIDKVAGGDWCKEISK